jgi:hypothetical protein
LIATLNGGRVPDLAMRQDLDRLAAEDERGDAVAAVRSTVTLALIRLAKAIPCWTALPASADPSVGIRMLVYIAFSLIADL